MFFQIGTMGSYLKQMQLQTKWNLKQQDCGGEASGRMSSSLLQADVACKEIRLNSIVGKLRIGQRLSIEELSWLRQNSPALYAKAVRIEQERTGFRKQLERCSTKEEARRAHENKTQQLVCEGAEIGKSGMSSGDKLDAMDTLQMRMAAVDDEYRSFLGRRGAATEPHTLTRVIREKKNLKYPEKTD